MALSRVKNFEFIQPAWDTLRYSANGIVGRDIDRRARYVEAMARAQVGVESGALRGTVSRSNVFPSKLGPYATIGAGGPKAPYAMMHHEGTRPHEITPRAKRGMLKFNIGSKTVYATRVMHPGTRANKYLTDHLQTAVNL